MRRSRRPAGLAALLVAGALVLTGCGMQFPGDPDGSLERIRTEQVLRVGASADPGLVDTADGEATGPLADLVTDFATEQGAVVDWTVASEETLVADLESGSLDVVIGGMTADTGWVDRVGVTRGYPQIDGSDDREIVLFVPAGENGLLSELERFLDAELAS